MNERLNPQYVLSDWTPERRKISAAAERALALFPASVPVARFQHPGDRKRLMDYTARPEAPLKADEGIRVCEVWRQPETISLKQHVTRIRKIWSGDDVFFVGENGEVFERLVGDHPTP